MTTPPYWHTAKAHLTDADPVLARIIAQLPNEALVSRGDAFFTLARSIAGQQISVKAAESIWRRIAEGLGEIHPTRLLALEDDHLRSFGLSQSKVKYLRALSAWFAEDMARMHGWAEKDDEAIIAELTTIPGIGRWTAEMFLIFHAGKPDVLPLGDVGLVKAMEKLYNEGEKLSKAELTGIGARWQPYRSVATWYLWRSLDPLPVEY